MAVYVANLQIESGTDFEHLFSLGDNDNNTTLDLTGYSVASKLRKWAGSDTAYTFTSSVSSATDGQITIAMTDSTTNTIKPGRYIYDVVLTESSSGLKTRVVEGQVLVRQGVTR